MSERIDFYNLTAIKVHNMPEGWRWCMLNGHDAPEGFFKLSGAVPLGTWKSGRRKGREKWPPKKELDVIWMSLKDVSDVMQQWELETGNCSKCCGDGQIIDSAKVTENGVVKTFRKCKACNGSGSSDSIPMQ